MKHGSGCFTAWEPQKQQSPDASPGGGCFYHAVIGSKDSGQTSSHNCWTLKALIQLFSTSFLFMSANYPFSLLKISIIFLCPWTFTKGKLGCLQWMDLSVLNSVGLLAYSLLSWLQYLIIPWFSLLWDGWWILNQTIGLHNYVGFQEGTRIIPFSCSHQLTHIHKSLTKWVKTLPDMLALCQE